MGTLPYIPSLFLDLRTRNSIYLRLPQTKNQPKKRLLVSLFIYVQCIIIIRVQNGNPQSFKNVYMSSVSFSYCSTTSKKDLLLFQELALKHKAIWAPLILDNHGLITHPFLTRNDSVLCLRGFLILHAFSQEAWIISDESLSLESGKSASVCVWFFSDSKKFPWIPIWFFTQHRLVFAGRKSVSVNSKTWKNSCHSFFL